MPTEKQTSEQLGLIKATVLEEALAKLIAKRDRQQSNLTNTKEAVTSLQAAMAAD